MPMRVTIRPKPDLPRDVTETQRYRAAKARGEFETFMGNAREILTRMGDILEIKPRSPDTIVEHRAEADIDRMEAPDLKMLALAVGVKFGAKKRINAADLRRMIRERLDSIEVVDEDLDGDTEDNASEE